MSFFTGFATGFAQRATEMQRESEQQRNQAIERAMTSFRTTMEKRQEALREREAQRAQAQALAASVPGLTANTAETFVMGGLGEGIASGRFSFGESQAPQGGAPSAPQTPTQGGLMAPPGSAPASNSVPSNTSPVTAPATPVASQATPSVAANTNPNPAPAEPQADPREGFGKQLVSAMFGRNPFEGVEEEVRNRYMTETGMTREQMDRLLAPPERAPGVDTPVRLNPFSPADLAKMAGNFTNPEGFKRFVESGGKDTSGLATLADVTKAQTMISAAGAAARAAAFGGRPPNQAVFNAAYRQFDLMLENNPNFHRVPDRTDPTGQRTLLVPKLTGGPEAEAMRARLAAARAAIDGFVADGMSPAQAALAASRQFGLISEGGGGNPGQPNSGTLPPPRTTNNSNIPLVTNEAQYNAIPRGGQYRDPEGNIRTKQ